MPAAGASLLPKATLETEASVAPGLGEGIWNKKREKNDENPKPTGIHPEVHQAFTENRWLPWD